VEESIIKVTMSAALVSPFLELENFYYKVSWSCVRGCRCGVYKVGAFSTFAILCEAQLSVCVCLVLVVDDPPLFVLE